MDDGEPVIVITGAAGGMGMTCVPALAAAGHLLLVDLHEGRLAPARAAATAAGGSASILRCDVTRAADVAHLADSIRAMGPLHAIVHTAGISPKMAGGRQVLDVDLVGTARVLDALAPLAQPGTAAICIASIAGYSDVGSEVDELLDDPLAPGFVAAVEARLALPLDGDLGYVLAKRGVMRLCERLAGEWGARGGRIVSVSPGLMDTGMGRFELENQELMQAMADATPIKRPGTASLPGRPEDIAQLVAFLCSAAASFISGCDIRVDGGLIGAARHLGFGG